MFNRKKNQQIHDTHVTIACIKYHIKVLDDALKAGTLDGYQTVLMLNRDTAYRQLWLQEDKLKRLAPKHEYFA